MTTTNHIHARRAPGIGVLAVLACGFVLAACWQEQGQRVALSDDDPLQTEMRKGEQSSGTADSEQLSGTADSGDDATAGGVDPGSGTAGAEAAPSDGNHGAGVVPDDADEGPDHAGATQPDGAEAGTAPSTSDRWIGASYRGHGHGEPVDFALALAAGPDNDHPAFGLVFWHRRISPEVRIVQLADGVFAECSAIGQPGRPFEWECVHDDQAWSDFVKGWLPDVGRLVATSPSAVRERTVTVAGRRARCLVPASDSAASFPYPGGAWDGSPVSEVCVDAGSGLLLRLRMEDVDGDGLFFEAVEIGDPDPSLLELPSGAIKWVEWDERWDAWDESEQRDADDGG